MADINPNVLILTLNVDALNIPIRREYRSELKKHFK